MYFKEKKTPKSDLQSCPMSGITFRNVLAWGKTRSLPRATNLYGVKHELVMTTWALQRLGDQKGAIWWHQLGLPGDDIIGLATLSSLETPDLQFGNVSIHVLSFFFFFWIILLRILQEPCFALKEQCWWEDDLMGWCVEEVCVKSWYAAMLLEKYHFIKSR